MSALLVAGTTSDAGKSIVTTGLCRAFSRRGVKVAPYKAQNMSNNSMVCLDRGGIAAEIGRAQWIQALAARATPEPAMNPVLLKPGSDQRSHVVVMGQPAGEVSSRDFADGRRQLARAAYQAFDSLSDRFEVVVAEGAGSPAEINLRASDYVNMGLARHGAVPTIVVGDIDRGGVFAAMFGTVALLSPEDQRLIAGFVVNKFRGERSLLAPGLTELEQLTGRRVYGVLPWHPDLWLDSEDALELGGRRTPLGSSSARVAVIRLPRISNFTDVDALGLEPDLDVVFVSDERGLADADLVVLPGTRATMDDLAWLRARGLDRALRRHAGAGRPVLGICGGCQMLGREITDPPGVEGPPRTVPGLGLLDLRTEFTPDKVLRLHGTGGYEIHHGRVLGELVAGNVRGTMVHGSLEDDAARAVYLSESLGIGSRASFPAARDRRLELLADLVEEHLDIDALLSLPFAGAPAGLPVLPPGASR
ncbi:MAG: cobyric acid synthase [Propionibacteriales bacterium]|nr:cobyric acid synthase [Propionibacteriales bacterium]